MEEGHTPEAPMACRVKVGGEGRTVEAGAKRILIPSDNKRDLAEVPDAILTATQWQFYDSPTKAAIMAMGMG